MKKSLILLLAFLSLSLGAFAASYNPSSRVSEIGNALLTKNGISIANVKFEVTSRSVDNSTFAQDRIVSVSKDDLQYAGNDNETAAVVANELGYIISGNASKDRFITSVTGNSSNDDVASSLVKNYTYTKAQKEADVIAVNLMANAGYNPLAAIVVLTKQTSTYWNVLQGKPANADRAMNIYDYTGYAYPAKLKAGYSCNEYKSFLIYADSVLAQRKENKSLEEKSQKELKKYRQNSLSQISKFKTRGGLTFWDALFGIFRGE